MTKKKVNMRFWQLQVLQDKWSAYNEKKREMYGVYQLICSEGVISQINVVNTLEYYNN